ncbi:MAG: hypothetical protein LAO03_09995 [Acidobacteriia bacterium]|nr:hypothetical protein [Terriglobia bacterium]
MEEYSKAKYPAVMKANIILLGVVVILSWGALLLRLVKHWHVLSSDAAYYLTALAVLYPLPWVAFLRDKNAKLSTANITYVALLTATIACGILLRNA